MSTSAALAPLSFGSVQFEVVDRNNQPWLRGPQIGDALGYHDGQKKIHDLYTRNAAEFTDRMTALVKLPTEGGLQETRIFSLRGAHLLGMFARTAKAAEFRRWVLDVLDRETGPDEPQQAPKPVQLGEPPLVPWPQPAQTGYARTYTWTFLAEYYDAVFEILQDGRKPPRPAEFRRWALDRMTAAPRPALPNGSPAPVSIPHDQRRVIQRHLNQAMALFHPLSTPFSNLLSLARALRGRDPHLTQRIPGWVEVLPTESGSKPVQEADARALGRQGGTWRGDRHSTGETPSVGR